ncbi:MAG: hypothetical protein MUC62_00745, partial [Candidatus Thermoplasmatota archaeon]|nr:hypothetical protein [Candidatus Thermoplasmatota archaeon]
METKVSIGLLLIGALLLTSLISGRSDGSEPKLRTSLAWSSASFIGEDANDYSGISIGSAGDVNGDGYDDLLIGAYGDDDGGADAGQAYLILGAKDGWAMDRDLSMASASFWGEDAGDEAGRRVAGAGDVNGDGYDDILIGAPMDDDGGINAGQTYLILGKATGWTMDVDLSTASASFWGEMAGDISGGSICGAGDVNADGYDDILIGADGSDAGGSLSGQSYLILGKKTGWAMDTGLSSSSASFWGEDPNDGAGRSVAGAGDVNGDGYNDILIVATLDDDGGLTNRGQTYLILGKQSGWAMDTDLSTASASFLGTNTDDQSGISVSGAGDVNGDGYGDFLIGANLNDGGGSNSGQVYLIFGKMSGWSMDIGLSASDASFIGEELNDHLGEYVSGAGDTNNDGYDDIFVGAMDNDQGGPNAGQAYLIYGKATGWSMGTDLTTSAGSFRGEKGADMAGIVDSAGDVDGNGYADLMISAMYNNEGGSAAGQTYLILSHADPPGPRNLRTSLASDQAQITLRWDAPNTWAEPLQCYRIYRSTDGSDYQYLGWTGTSTRTYVDSSVAVGSTYRYEVIADYDQGDNYQGKAMISILCDIDTDGDGVGNMADWDDDGDGIADQSDAFPIDKVEWLDTDLDGEGNEADKDDDNDGIGDTDDVEPLNPLNGVKLDLAKMSSDLFDTRDEITLLLEGIGFDLENINDTLIERIDELDLKISAQLYQLRALIESVNASVQTRLSRLDTDLTAFRS